MPVIAPVPTPADFIKKWNLGFADNTIRKITEKTFREFAADIAATFGVTVANVPAYQPGTTYQDGYLVRFTPNGGNESFFYSLTPGVLPEPSTDPADKNGRLVPGPVSTVALSQQLTLSQAQAIEGLLVVPGRSYLIDFGPDASGNAQLVTLLGTAANLFAIRGQLTVAGVRSNVRVNVISGVFGVEAFALLDTANSWLGVQDFTKGVKLPIGSYIDDNGRLYIRQVDVGQKHFTFGRHYSLAKDALIQWKADEFISQDGDGDVGLGRSSAGVLEVNTGTAGQRATLLVKEIEAENAHPTLNTLGKIGAALGLRAGLLTTAKTSLVAAINELLAKIPIAGYGLELRGGALSLRTSVARVFLGPGTVGGYVSYGDGTIQTANQFSPPSANYTYSNFIKLPPPGTPYSVGPYVPQQAAFYDANFQYVRAIEIYQDPSAGVIPPNCAYARLSSEHANYTQLYFAYNNLPYVRSFNGKLPNGEGDISVPVGAIINQFTGTTAAPQAVTTAQFYFNGAGLYQWVGNSGPVGAIAKTNANWRVIVEGGAGGAGGSSYTDAQARAAQLNRVAPAGTTAVTFQAESPTDYVFYSGTFTVDVTSAVAGVVVFVELGAGATPPTLDPAVFELANGGSYVAGSRNEYAFRVTGTGKIHYALNQLA